jgi:hypothetical protein
MAAGFSYGFIGRAMDDLRHHPLNSCITLAREPILMSKWLDHVGQVGRARLDAGFDFIVSMGTSHNELLVGPRFASIHMDTALFETLSRRAELCRKEALESVYADVSLEWDRKVRSPDDMYWRLRTSAGDFQFIAQAPFENDCDYKSDEVPFHHFLEALNGPTSTTADVWSHVGCDTIGSTVLWVGGALLFAELEPNFVDIVKECRPELLDKTCEETMAAVIRRAARKSPPPSARKRPRPTR